LSWKPIYKTHLPRFANEIKEVIDPRELQKWAVITLSKSNSDSSKLPLKDVPEPIRILHSNGGPIEMAFYQIGSSPKSRCITLMWGGGFGHWGIDVGAPSFEEPADDNFYIKWIPGVYFWEQTR
jgi:hypothetical protein